MEYGTWRSHLGGLAGALRRPALLVRLLRFVLRNAWRQPRQLAASLCWVPRSLGIYRAVERRAPDVVHLFWGHYPALVGRLVLDRLPRVALTTSLGAYDLTMGYRGGSEVAQEAGMVRTYAAVNVPALLDLGIPEGRIVVEYHGIDLSLIPRPQPGKVRGRIVTAGRLIPVKGMDDVLRVLAEVRAAHPHATLHVLGGGPDRRRLERLADELGVSAAVEFTGHVPHARVFRALAEAEILLFLTRHDAERLPNVVKEAMACGCTPVVNDCLGIEELVVDGTGFVVAPGDLAAAVEAVTRLLAEGAASRERRLAAARRHVLAHFDPSRIARRLADRWAELVRRSGAVAVREEGR